MRGVDRIGRLAAAAAIVLMGGCGESRGPLQGAEVSSLGIPAAQDKAQTFGLPVVFNVGDGSEEVTLERVELERPDRGLVLVGALAAANGRQLFYTSSAPGFPPRQRSFGRPRGLRGTVVAPADSPAGKAGVELLIGLRSTRPGRVGAWGLVVHYREGDRSRRVRVPNAVVLCTAPAGRVPPRECEEGPLPPRGDTRTGSS